MKWAILGMKKQSFIYKNISGLSDSVNINYKDRKCAVNENPSLHIESAGSKTSNNGPLKNESAVSIARMYVGSKIVCFYESDDAFKTIWRRPCSCHLIKTN